MITLEVKDLMVFYENAIAINNVNLRCRERELTGIFGANSAGKSTLMYTMSGIILDVQRKEKMRGGERVTVLGSIFYNGADITQIEASSRARMGIILCPERRRIFQESSVMENLRIGGILASKAQGKKTLEYVFSIFPRLQSMKRRDGGFLSGGEQQMLAIGRALMARPKLLLLDEPSMGLSPLMVREIFNKIATLREQGTTILLVEQNARMALSIADRGYVLETGKIVLQGSREELFENKEIQRAYLGKTHETGRLRNHIV